MKDSNLYITNLPKDVTEEDIDRIFGQYGEIVQRTVLKDKITGMPRGVAFVRFVEHLFYEVLTGKPRSKKKKTT